MIPQLAQQNATFRLDDQRIHFQFADTQGYITISDAAVYLGAMPAAEFRGFLTAGVVVPGTLSNLHRDIKDDTRCVTFQDLDKATLVGEGQTVELKWHHPNSADKQFVNVLLDGRRVGNSVQSKKQMQYLQKCVRDGIILEFQNEYGISKSIFNNCTFNITISTGQDRLSDAQLVLRLLKAYPELAQRYKFAPDAQSANCNGLYHCSEATNIWKQVHNAAVEKHLRVAALALEGLSPADESYIGSRRGISDIRATFAGEVLDDEFEAKLDANLDIFAFANGCIDWARGVRRAIRPEDFVQNHAMWSYDSKEAQKYKAELKDFLRKVLPIKAERRTTMRFFATLLSGRRVTKKFLVLTDRRAGNNGKSTFMTLIRRFFGAMYSVEKTNAVCRPAISSKDKDSHDAGLQAFAGKRLLTAEELKKWMILNDEFIKKFAGGQGQMADGRKFGKGGLFNYVWSAGIVLIFNEGDMPKIDTADAALLGRTLVAPFRSLFLEHPGPEEYTFQVDPQINVRFPLWMSSLLDMLEKLYLPAGLRESDIPASMREWRSDLVCDASPLAEWLEERIAFSEDDKLTIWQWVS